jgi:hypothetical protein
MTRIRKRLLLAGITGTAVVLLCGVLLLRPTVRANRTCRDAGFGGLPASARDLHIVHRGPPFSTQSIYLRFRVTAEDARAFLERGGIGPADESTSMQTVGFGVKGPSWMQWDESADGRLYHINRSSASVWLAIDDASGTIYMGVFEFRPVWFRRLLRRG